LEEKILLSFNQTTPDCVASYLNKNLWRAFADNLQLAISNFRTSGLDSFKHSFDVTSDLYCFIGVPSSCLSDNCSICHNTCRANNMIEKSDSAAILTLRSMRFPRWNGINFDGLWWLLHRCSAPTHLPTISLRLHQPFTYVRDLRASITWLFAIEDIICLWWPEYFCSRSNAIIMHNKLYGIASKITYFDKKISDTFTSLAILVDLPSSSYREGVQDNNWLLYLQVMSFIWFVVCSFVTAHFALWTLHVITVKCRVSLREDSHFARFASELFRTML
jgi:hypothetical protein